jgi:hypothetical protein
MQLTPNGASEYHDGNQIGRYARDLEATERVFVWYHCGLDSNDSPAWAMDTDVEWKISVSVDTIYVADKDDGLFAIDRDAFVDSVVEIDGREQCMASADDGFVHYIGDPNEHMHGNLWIESGNQVDEGYHKQRNEA